MLFLITVPANNTRGPRYMEKSLAAMHQGRLRRTAGTQQYWMKRHSRQRLADRIKSALTWLRNLIRQFGSDLFQWFRAKQRWLRAKQRWLEPNFRC